MNLNREQLRDAVKILRDTIPVVVHIMLHNPDQVWGEAAYPAIDEKTQIKARMQNAS